VFAGLTFNFFYAWPHIEKRYTKDLASHELLDRPRDRPKRTAFGAAMLMFYFMLFCASSTDVMANFFNVSLNTVLWTFRVIVFLIPVITYFVTFRICNEMRAAEGIGKRKRAMVVNRSATGAYSTTPTEPRPGDGAHELDPIPVPTYINMTPEELETAAGVRRVMR
jgi:ubiquinol-cytochrome c reductase cytochrome b subunit